ncbi:30S ribosomal protein S18 [Candidatus Falkowbacteria bacterium RIFOXYB2_FULL_38_15]|uniref:Small ribosomal subunit protein bS18 n=1 Tax=Candidatus Falkowbacteria bacterium RIFOXYA2_FULL_38_12 TaxID=1797993 RepID=A0A1F5S450_9BACT|nr:MAG: 30S ribosomal protein S18 [Candidatus Falkowbacteria bacterium RIFOXYA2_FULL_38_12]OGF32615.1 MAG: 30S ribosomal protein S18 [Candidatus Falkowbacteria bacterium RIFOXYB2_FULL_38_15]OGF44576.1 MAG: 30S ribosomal protein S18 [Candidatus Falkowbacteria bacterium RIFOXYD2_FULL_39_16]
MQRTNRETTQQKKTCFFCLNNNVEIDYKDAALLGKFISSYGKIMPRKRSGSCTKHQRKMANAIKRARAMGIMSFTSR